MIPSIPPSPFLCSRRHPAPSLRWTRSTPHPVLSSTPATAGLSLQLIGTFDLFGSAPMLHRGVRAPWLSSPTKESTYTWEGHRRERECFDGTVENCFYERLFRIREVLSPFNLFAWILPSYRTNSLIRLYTALSRGTSRTHPRHVI